MDNSASSIYPQRKASAGRARSLSFNASQQTTATLLDIDKTLIFDEKDPKAKFGTKVPGIHGVIYKNLLKYLKQNKIEDVYLFTKMRNLSQTEGEGSLVERNLLIAYLREQGFRVHGVITAQDYTFHISPSELRLFRDSYEQAYGNPRLEKDSVAEKNYKKEILERILENSSKEFPAIRRLIAGHFEDQRWIGDAYAGASKHPNPHELYESSLFQQQVSDILSLGKESKTLMFEQFMRQKPSYVKEVLVFEDLEEELKAIRHAAQEYDCPVYTFHVTGLDQKELNNAIKQRGKKSKQSSIEGNDATSDLSASQGNLGNRGSFWGRSAQSATVSPTVTPPSRGSSDEEKDRLRAKPSWFAQLFGSSNSKLKPSSSEDLVELEETTVKSDDKNSGGLSLKKKHSTASNIN